MKIHILCPLYRIHLVPTLIHYLKPMGIEWYPIMTPSEGTKFKADINVDRALVGNESWVHPVYIDGELSPRAKCCQKFNDFLDIHKIVDDDYYAFMCDDNMYEPGFFDIIRKQTSKIVICALYRGDAIPKGDGVASHGTSILKPRNNLHVRPKLIDYAQFIIKGELFKNNRFMNVGCADGVYIQKLVKSYPRDVTYLTELYALFNYFQPGRYTKKEKFPKSHWELPQLVT